MLYPHEKLDTIVKNMRSFGEFLVPYNFPRASQKDEEAVNCPKTQDVHVDGYNLILHYSKAGYEANYVETLQVLGKYSPFLPFSLVCKIGKRFLGEDYLSLVEIFRENRKIYCWTKITDLDGTAVPGPHQSDLERCIYEGFSYLLMHPSNVNFY
jgi:hypothetical protein